MTKLGIAKLVINIAAGLGVSKITNDIITTNTTVNDNGDKIKVAIGSLVIGSMVGEMASDHVNAKIDAVANLWQSRKIKTSPVEMTGNLNETAA
jgi:hypothetical protein